MQEQAAWAVAPQAAETHEMATLNYKVRELEMRLMNLESRIPNSNIISHKFWSRAFAVVGHQLSVALIINAIFIVIAIVILTLMSIGMARR